MTTKKCNWKTDLQLVETFYTFAENNTLIATPIPDDAIDFQIVYRAEHDRRYAVSRTRGDYKGCKKIDDNTLAVFIPLSRYSLGRGPLLRELYMQVPNNDFEGKIRNICVPANTKHFLWDGPTDNDVVVATEIITATILKGNTGDSAYKDAVQHGYEGTEEEYALWPIVQGNYAKEQAGIAKKAATAAQTAAETANTAISHTETAITNTTTATVEAKKATDESKVQTAKVQKVIQETKNEADRAAALADHPPKIVDVDSTAYWAFWDEQAKDYVVSSCRANGSPLYATFGINPETMCLEVTYPTGYGDGPVFSIKEGNLCVTVN